MTRPNRDHIVRSLQRLFAITGEQPTLQLENSILPVVNAFNLDDPPYSIKRGFTWSRTIPAAGAGQYSGAGIGLPYFSSGDYNGKICVVRRIEIVNPNATPQTFGFFWDASAHFGTDAIVWDWDQPKTPRDATHRNVGAVSIRYGSKGSPTPVGFEAWHSQLFGQERVEIPGPFVIRLQQCLNVQLDQANLAICIGFQGDVYEE